MVRKTTKKVIKKRTKKVQKGKGIVDTAKALLFGRTQLPPQVRKILEKNGNTEIDYIQVARNPLATTTKMALDAVSFGAFSKRAKKLPYDKLYHLYIVFTLICLKIGNELIEVALHIKRKLTLLLILKQESHLENKKKKIIKIQKFNLKRLQNPKLIKVERRMLKRNSLFY